MANRFALIIANYEYQDPMLRKLVAPAQDAEALARVLGDPIIGTYELQPILLNKPSYVISRAIESFFSKRKRDDLLLLYFSGHGLKDDDGKLYFATADTERDLLRATSISANFVNEAMLHSNSRRQVLVLDCCFSGAFAKGMVAKADDLLGAPIGTREQFDGLGRVILTASDAFQYAFEGKEVKGEGTRSIFTRALVTGLETGEADENKDGDITFEELYDYVFKYVSALTPKQTPRRWDLDIQGKLVIAHNPRQWAKNISWPLPGISLPEPPTDIRDELGELQEKLNQDIPSKETDKNLLLATWNIRSFAGLTEKWKSGPKDSPKRDFHALLCIAEIISRFDLVSISELKGDLRILDILLMFLGQKWDYLITDISGPWGNAERRGVLFDSRRVRLSGLVGEISIPAQSLDPIGSGALGYFSRIPYAFSFRSAGTKFTMISVQLTYDGAIRQVEERIDEVKALAEWFADWAKTYLWGHNVILLGDFNIDRKGNPIYDAFTSTGLVVPESLDQVPRTIFSDPGRPDTDRFYDQIAWFMEDDFTPALTVSYSRGGTFDFPGVAMKSRNLSKQELSWRISDHYPLWVEFLLRGEE